MGFTYTRIITDEEEKIMKDQVLDPKDWIDKAIEGKTSNCSGHCAKRRREELIKKGEKTIPATELDLARNAFADPDYKDRATRDQEELLKKEK